MGRTSKVTVIGNACAGKTVLSRRLAQLHNLPLIHVDSIQFAAGMKIKPHKESISILEAAMKQDKWLIDGYGPLDILEKRFQAADVIILIDFPVWRNYWWGIKRQIRSLWAPREELPSGCFEATVSQTLKLYKSIRNVHRQMRPELLRILSRDPVKSKLIVIRTYTDWNRIFQQGIL